MPTISELLTSRSDRVSPQTRLREVAAQMLASGLSSVIVVDGGVAVGIITERDILRVMRQQGFARMDGRRDDEPPGTQRHARHRLPPGLPRSRPPRHPPHRGDRRSRPAARHRQRIRLPQISRPRLLHASECSRYADGTDLSAPAGRWPRLPSACSNTAFAT